MIHVAVGLHVRADGAFLVARRAFDRVDRAAGRWEFPGGKVRPGEDPAATCAREWCEELGVRGVSVVPAPCAEYRDSSRVVSLFRVIALWGEPARNPAIHCAVSYFPLSIFALVGFDSMNDAMPTFMAALAAHNMTYGSLHDFGTTPPEPTHAP